MIFTGTFRRPKTGESEKILLKLTIEKTSWITLAGRRKKINRQTRIMTRHTVGEGTVSALSQWGHPRHRYAQYNH